MAMTDRIIRDRKKEMDSGYVRVSRWIKLDYTNITHRHSLANYAYDNGEDLTLTYFMHGGKMYALGQFMRLSEPITLEDGSIISGYDCTQWYNPLLIEIRKDGEAVRLYEEKQIQEVM